ncbi:hypothetical protein DPMN_179669 [Dreissena polymorpha]|uniref:Uncharacterized protein n=1 Tax=Dreissena polymorpha TaxID=45954 RepID=A0A9D4EHI8_DREPO|nr:hypothetical protein DPMN_179669 [Dreissena polymorpha]
MSRRSHFGRILNLKSEAEMAIHIYSYSPDLNCLPLHGGFCFPYLSGKQELSSVLLQIFRDRKRNPPRAGEELFLDVLMEYTEDEEVQFCDALVYTIGGFHTAGNCKLFV